jgi:hypothetical protein
MKYLRIILCLSVLAFLATSSIASANCSCCTASPMEITIAKAGDTTSKVKLGSTTVIAPICFADGASWDSVKDSYNVDCKFAHLLKKGKAGISIASDGTATFKQIKK